ncbi:cytochrome o ubiquinol oxidase subunit III [Roseibium album]|uniref:Cytochrome bo(3) ubiquinol oxidase subunit 3 n=1 Tax=Roseibium album TaxID=311410 RepID=A0A0M6ZA96_9HYPH|nr:cytochrome o ubiquinol oxidase subunit III [Roseibium album]MBG6166660.1 cytochrome o ubiquinol oxidase subunit 3 [Labrenzia sp. EL_195]MBG6202812.1 cytochrome o ubiquinol oxidase subunit 3 [Labrenzia sp. EL_13]CTQ59022.1 Cytochrome o ubiquinol oxidase subunit 3 [Roseibium album]CTQ63968.1 Cytochrome o ubiquinol oxidase subunit 3 [Roseibium album]CTQ73649.1 Cytochrome o ubiquinol oxidase subunit 3 [Roseibium album]
MSETTMNEDLLEHEERKSLESREFGFWVYLMTDAIIFALLFASYVVLSKNSAAGPTSKDVFDLSHTAGETALLLFSSLTFGLATIAMSLGQTGRVVQWLFVTLALGLGFLAMEMIEFSGMIGQGAGPETSGFLSAFFTLVGTHGLHVAFGVIGICVMIGQVLVKGLTIPVRSRLFRLGLFWHFLDIVWIGIFSVVYLPGVM